MKSKKALEIFTKYSLFGIKPLLALAAVLFKEPSILYFYFLADLGNAFYQGIEDDKNQDLSIENSDQLKSLKLNYDQMAKTQEIYIKNQERKEYSLKLLNKLVSDSLIREKDLLSFAGTSGYYQLFVYSASLSRLAKSLKIETVIVRKYPAFLESLGFVRLGKNSTLFVINKNRLKDEQLKNIKEFKKFLIYHFSKIRKQEWQTFLEQIKKMNRREFTRLNGKGYKEWGYLKYNFLITETNMNPTNLGFVDGDRMGLGDTSRRDEIYGQILEKPKLGTIQLSKELKIKIKRIIEKQDISLLIEGLPQKDRNQIDLSQDQIKENIGIENVINFSNVNADDLSNELVKTGFSKRRSNTLAQQITSVAKQYKEALDELGINI